MARPSPAISTFAEPMGNAEYGMRNAEFAFSLEFEKASGHQSDQEQRKFRIPYSVFRIPHGFRIQ